MHLIRALRDCKRRSLSDKEIFFEKSFGAVALLVGLSTGNPLKIGTITGWNRPRNNTRTPPEYCPHRNGYNLIGDENSAQRFSDQSS